MKERRREKEEKKKKKRKGMDFNSFVWNTMILYGNYLGMDC